VPLDTLANVKQALGVTAATDDAALEQLAAMADGAIATYCGRRFDGGSFTETHPGAAKLIFLANYPVAAIASLHVDVEREYPPETLRSADQYILHASRGVVESRDGPFIPTLSGWTVSADAFPDAVRVAYSTAANAVPEAIKRAYAELIGQWYRQRKTHASSGQLNLIGTGDTSYPWGQSGGFRLPAGVKELLAAYRVPVA